ncbi:hypothetical protein IMCC26134_05860 [Verrucomicrobia bacterium IMCC26134]|nr:hypothetical protein IMCC26134_05860 [Verrucomicrobia bacterium IMCC26134]
MRLIFRGRGFTRPLPAERVVRGKPHQDVDAIPKPPRGRPPTPRMRIVTLQQRAFSSAAAGPPFFNFGLLAKLRSRP